MVRSTLAANRAYDATAYRHFIVNCFADLHMQVVTTTTTTLNLINPHPHTSHLPSHSLSSANGGTCVILPVRSHDKTHRSTLYYYYYIDIQYHNHQPPTRFRFCALCYLGKYVCVCVCLPGGAWFSTILHVCAGER